MKEVPAKVEHNNQWVVVKLGIGEDRIVIPAPVNKEVLFKTVSDVAERKNVLIITAKTDTETVYKILSVEKVIQVLKKLILGSCNAYRLMAYFMSPAIRGGVLIKDAQWEKGSVVVVHSGIWFVSPAKQICVPVNDVAAIETHQTGCPGKTHGCGEDRPP